MKKSIFFKSIAAGLSAAALAPLFLNPSVAEASTNGKTAANAISWVKSKLGKGIDYDGVYGNQCVDLIKAYYVYLGNSAVRGNGCDYTSNAKPSAWGRIKGATPKKGDILIYTGGYGGYGHVAIYESDYSTYHQNWNGHSYVERVTSKYNASGSIRYWGVIRPDFKAEAQGNSGTSATAAKYTGVKNVNGIWTYVKNDLPDYSFSGVARSTTGNWVYVSKGRFDTSYTGVAKSTTGNWVFVKKGRFDPSYTGVARSTTGNWVFVKNGRYETSYTGVAKSTTGNWVFVRNGRYDTTFTGVAKSINNNWVYVKNGRYTSAFTGIASVINSSKKYYMVKGRWNRTFTGVYRGYNIKNGVVV